MMAEGEGGGPPAVVVSDEPQGFLDDLEKAKALSLETLELDRIRREQKALQRMKIEQTTTPTVRDHTVPVFNASHNKTHTTAPFIGNTSGGSTKGRPRPGFKPSITVEQKLPPPPRRQSSGNVFDRGASTAETADLMVFSQAEHKEKKNSAIADLESSIGVIFDCSEWLSTSSSTTTSKSFSAIRESSAVEYSNLSGTTVPYVGSFPPSVAAFGHHSVQRFSCLNSAGHFQMNQSPVPLGIVPVFSAPPSQPPLLPGSLQTFPNVCFASSASMLTVVDTPSPLLTGLSTTTLSNFTSSCLSSHKVSAASALTPSPVLQTAPAISDASVSVLKFIEKKRNSNLIDLMEVDDAFQTVLDSKSNPPSASNAADDLLKAFDPLLESSELQQPVPCAIPQSDTTFTPQSAAQTEEEEQYAVLWKWAAEETTTKKVLSFEDNFDPLARKEPNDEEREESPPPPLPPRPKASPEAITASTVVLREKAVRTQQLLRRSRQSRNYESIKVVRCTKGPNSEVESLCNMVCSLRSEFLHNDYHTNVGLVISPTLESLREESTSVKLVITSVHAEKPILFTCDVTTTLEHIISHVVCTLFDDSNNINFENFVLKVHGLAEYFSADSSLVDYEYVHYCQKFDEDVRLTLIDSNDLQRPLARTAHDDKNDVEIKVQDLLPVNANPPLTQDSLSILLETFEHEVEKMREQALRVTNRSLQPKGVIQAVKAICTILSQVETNEITEAVEGVIQVSMQFGKSKPAIEMNSGFTVSEEEIFNDAGSFTVIELVNQLPNTPNVRMELLQLALERLNLAIRELLDMYCHTFQVDFYIPTPPILTPGPTQELSSFVDTLLVHIGSVHRLPVQWSTTYDDFVVVCQLYHGSRIIAAEVETRPAKPSLSLYEQIQFDEWLEFSLVTMSTIPREARLVFTLFGSKMIAAESKLPDAGQVVRTTLPWAVVQLFKFDGVLHQGSSLCGMWPEEVDKTYGPAVHNTDPHCPIIQVSLPDFGCPIVFPTVTEGSPTQQQEFEVLDSYTQQKLLSIIERPSMCFCTEEEKDMLWDKRHYLHEIPQALPRILLSAPRWNWACLSDIYCMLHQWKAMNPIDALELLLPSFPDIEVRKVAINWVKNLGSDELCDYLPQLVQALKYETWSNNKTAKFLLERSLTSIRVAHHLYWLLKQNLDDPRCGQRIHLILNAMLAISGRAMRSQFECQEELMRSLSQIAEKIKTTKDSLRLNTLLHELESVHYSLEDKPSNLPLSPALQVVGVEVKTCSYFTSHTLPLKVNFKRGYDAAKPFEAILKVGDDLRQDMLTIQMIRIMDKLWLKEGLDLHIVTFGCIATGNKKGIVEMVAASETLRKIQTEHGLTGSFKDRPIAEWLQKHNPSELEYQQAVENFTCSCAGYSVATYVLGICDRHNDNIMLKTSGHMFHIDFGKFLGDSQMFGSIKRDRVPFVLTSDMAYVINGGDKPTSKFQQFVELCCSAFNVVRKHGSLFLNLFSLMASSGIPGVTLDGVSYIQRALLPDASDTEAAASFARMIEDSLKSWFTQFNFFIHNIAQLRFSGDQNDGTLLSFIPKAYTIETDGLIKQVKVAGYQKRYEPEKYYVYILKVERENQPDPTFLFRSYREFWEFRQKLCSQFPLAKYHNLPRTLYLGRSNIRQVAEKRKAEIDFFLQSIWKMADEIRHCDLVYTFLHPLLRDQQDGHSHLQKVKEPKERRSQYDGLIHGEVKLSIRYYSNTLFVMVMHAKNLSSSKSPGPDPYVKTYLMPDHNKGTKRKTKIVRRNCHPTFMEMLHYKFPLEIVQQRTLQVSVWDYDRMVENTFLGAISIALGTLDLTKETVQWYSLGNLYR